MPSRSIEHGVAVGADGDDAGRRRGVVVGASAGARVVVRRRASIGRVGARRRRRRHRRARVVRRRSSRARSPAPPGRRVIPGDDQRRRHHDRGRGEERRRSATSAVRRRRIWRAPAGDRRQRRRARTGRVGIVQIVEVHRSSSAHVGPSTRRRCSRPRAAALLTVPVAQPIACAVSASEDRRGSAARRPPVARLGSARSAATRSWRRTATGSSTTPAPRLVATLPPRARGLDRAPGSSATRATHAGAYSSHPSPSGRAPGPSPPGRSPRRRPAARARRSPAR